jgi:hypothetical protein
MLILSGTRDAVALNLDAVSIATGDIDHDGDADLVVATSSNRVVIWINDGRGHFTEEAPSRSQDMSPVETVAGASREEPIGIGSTVPQLDAPSRRRARAAETARRLPPLAPLADSPSFLSLPSLRGPPLTATLI